MKSEHMRRTVSAAVALVFLTFQSVTMMPAAASADEASDLKDIEYKHYFRGNYERAIEELRSYLERENLRPAQIVEAKEYLAASLILTGKTAEGKARYVELLKMDAAYPGPDPSVFKAVIIDTYEEARAEYVSTVIRTVPETTATQSTGADKPVPVSTSSSPFYKKWWFYATMGAVALVIAGAASSADGDTTPQERGTVTVDVDVP
jgi:hypothetical protein